MLDSIVRWSSRMRQAMAVMRYAVECMLHRVVILVVIWGIVVRLIDLVPIEEVIVVGLWLIIIVKEMVKCNGTAVILLDWTWRDIINDRLRV